MVLTIEEVEHVALLARLSLTEDQKNEFKEQLGAILEYVNMLNQLNTDDITPLDHILPICNIFREDLVVAGLPRDEMLQNAPVIEEGQYKVPKIL